MNPTIKVIGAGGSGSNTVSRMAKFEMLGVELISVNTDAQALHFSKADKKILIGKDITKGLGTGMDAERGKQAAEENKKEITECLNGADMVFVTCGLGGGTGSGATPVVAEIAKSLGILTVAVVTTPFSFEGSERKKVAEEALKNLEDKVDSSFSEFEFDAFDTFNFIFFNLPFFVVKYVFSLKINDSVSGSN